MTTIVGLNGTPPPFPDTNSYEPNFSAPNYVDSNYTLSVSSENIVSEAGIWIDSCASEATVRIGLYDMTGADAAGNGGALLWEDLVTFPSTTTNAFVTINPGAEIVGLADGAPLAVAVTRRISGSGLIMRRDTRNGDGFTMASASNLQDPSVTNGTLPGHQRYAYVTLIASGPALTAPASASPGETISFNASGFSGTVTGASLSDGTSTLPLTNVVNTSGFNYTADVPALPAVGNSLQYTTFGAVTMSATDGTDTAEDTTTLAAATGQTVTILAATFDTSELSYLFNFGGTPATGDQFIEGSPQLALDANGGYVADTDGTYVITGIDATDGVAQSYNLILGDEPVDPPVGIGRITRRNLTRRAITRRSITARP